MIPCAGFGFWETFNLMQENHAYCDGKLGHHTTLKEKLHHLKILGCGYWRKFLMFEFGNYTSYNTKYLLFRFENQMCHFTCPWGFIL